MGAENWPPYAKVAHRAMGGHRVQEAIGSAATTACPVTLNGMKTLVALVGLGEGPSAVIRLRTWTCPMTLKEANNHCCLLEKCKFMFSHKIVGCPFRKRFVPSAIAFAKRRRTVAMLVFGCKNCSPSWTNHWAALILQPSLLPN